MATSFTSLDYVFYKAGASGASAIVGYADSVNRVVRYKFTTPDEGATKISLRKGSLSEYDSSVGSAEKLRFYVGTDSASHKNAGKSAEYHGQLTVSSGVATGEAEINLLPNTDYYLFIFPGYASYGAYNWNYPGSITVTLEGAFGLVHIDTGSEIVEAIPYVDDGTQWNRCLPYVDNGSALVMGT